MDNLREGLLLGMGNPLLDISAVVTDDTLLSKYNLKPDDAVMANESQMPIYKELMENYRVEYIAGGSVQNSLRVAQWVLARPRVCTYFGCVGIDDYANILKERAIGDGVNVKYQYTERQPTGTCAVLISGAHRSLCANLAAATQFTEHHLTEPANKACIDSAEIFYVSGFFLAVSPPSVMQLAHHALSRGHTFVMNLSAPFVSQVYRQPLQDALPYVDILFGNETETLAFAQEFDIKETNLSDIAKKICGLPKQNENKKRVVVVTQGSNAVLLALDGQVTEIPVHKLSADQIVDTNGAGDAFAGGFLAQLVLKKPLETCVKCGIYAATQIIQSSGCTFKGKCKFES